MSKNILFVLEGKRTEPRFLKKIVTLMRTFEDYKVFSYGTNLYKMLEGMFVDGEIDDDLDFIEYLKSSKTSDDDPNILNNRFSDVYLFFDMDPQDQMYDPDKLAKASLYFSDSTDNGKLCINYPMFESLRHIPNLDDLSYMDIMVSKDDLTRYKEIVNEQGLASLSDISKIDEPTMIRIIMLNLQKSHMILGHGQDMPTLITYEARTSQQELLSKQQEEYNATGRLFVLNTCVFNAVDYNPERFFNKIAAMNL